MRPDQERLYDDMFAKVRTDYLQLMIRHLVQLPDLPLRAGVLSTTLPARGLMTLVLTKANQEVA